MKFSIIYSDRPKSLGKVNYFPSFRKINFIFIYSDSTKSPVIHKFLEVINIGILWSTGSAIILSPLISNRLKGINNCHDLRVNHHINWLPYSTNMLERALKFNIQNLMGSNPTRAKQATIHPIKLTE